AHLHAMVLTDARDRVEDFREPSARYDRVLHNECARNASHRTKGFLAALPESCTLVVGGGDTNLASAILEATATDGLDVVLQACFQSVHFTQENGGGVRWISSGVNRCLHRANGGIIHHLER